MTSNPNLHHPVAVPVQPQLRLRLHRLLPRLKRLLLLL